MNDLTLGLLRGIIMGLGATLLADLWAVFFKHTLKIAPPNFCLVGRWLRSMPEGIFRHASIAGAQKKHGECLVGWIAHYSIGITFAIVFLAFVGNSWLEHPTLLPALVFGIVTVLAPFLIMQPAFGLGVAASKTSNPMQSRVRSLINHIGFGLGLYLFGWVTYSLP